MQELGLGWYIPITVGICRTNCKLFGVSNAVAASMSKIDYQLGPRGGHYKIAAYVIGFFGRYNIGY